MPFRVPRADLSAFLKEFDRIPVQGYSVTIPHKEAAVAAAKYHDDAVIETQAANTLVRGPDGYHAYNTDYRGVLDALKAHLQPDRPAEKPQHEQGVIEEPKSGFPELGLSPVHDKAFTRFVMPWRWDGGPAVLQSRAWDEAGNVQPLRADFVAARGETKTPVATPLAFPNQHYNSITSWGIDSKGEIKHVYA